MLRFFKSWWLPFAILSLWFLWGWGILLHGTGENVLGALGFSHFDYDRAAKFGDAFGSLSSLMAALAAAGAWYAVGQSRRQAFEATFYNLMGHLNQIVTETDIQGQRTVQGDDGKHRKENTNLFRGRDAFGRMLRNLRLAVAGRRNQGEVESVLSGYKNFHDKYKNDLAHYFRTLYQVIRFIDDSRIDDKHLYARILRAQMSDAEQTLLMYNCAVGKGRAKFKKLVERYSLLHNCSLHENPKHWENTVLRPSFARAAFRDDESELWPTVGEVQADLMKYTIAPSTSSRDISPTPEPVSSTQVLL